MGSDRNERLSPHPADQGRKHVLALREGATENAEAAKDLLQHLVEHGVDPTRRRLFIIGCFVFEYDR
jgi:hypothetical protein